MKDKLIEIIDQYLEQASKSHDYIAATFNNTDKLADTILTAGPFVNAETIKSLGKMHHGYSHPIVISDFTTGRWSGFQAALTTLNLWDTVREQDNANTNYQGN